MCRSKAPRDNSADIARRAEEARQARIAEGRENIDRAFSGFDDDFYTNYQTDYANYYNPQLNDQYNDAVKRLTLQLATTGNLSGSVGADQLGDLQKYHDQQKLAITNQGLDARNQLHGNIDTKKSQLYADNRAAADPGSTASAAATAVQYLQPAPPSSPLANVFGEFFNTIGNNQAVRNTQPYRQGTGVQQYGGKKGGSYITGSR